MASETGLQVPGAADLAAAYKELLEWEANFDGWDLIYWIQANWMLPLVSCGIYVVMVFLGPVLLKGALCHQFSP